MAQNYAQARADTRLSETEARQRAVLRTQQATGILPTEQQIAAVVNPTALAGEKVGAERAATTAEELSPPAQQLREQKPIDEQKGREAGRLASRVTSEQLQNYLLPTGASPRSDMTQQQLVDSGAQEVGAPTIHMIDQVRLVQNNLRTMGVLMARFYSGQLPAQQVDEVRAEYETLRRGTARMIDKLDNMSGQTSGGTGGRGLIGMAVTTITGDMSHALDALPELEPKGIQRLIPQQPAPQPTPEGPGRVQELRDWISWLGSAGQPQVARNLRSIDASLRLMQEHLNVPWRRLFGTDAPQL